MGGGGRRKEGEVGWYNWRLGINDILESGICYDLVNREIIRILEESMFRRGYYAIPAKEGRLG